MNKENAPVDRYDGYVPNASFNPFSLKDWKRELTPEAWRHCWDENKRQWQAVRSALKGDWSGLRRELNGDKETLKFIWSDVKARGRLSREVLEGEGVRTVRELDAKRQRERENRR